MRALPFSNNLKINLQAASIRISLMLLALTQVPIAIKTSAELACIGEASNEIWKQSKSHKRVNMKAIQFCNGGNVLQKIQKD